MYSQHFMCLQVAITVYRAFINTSPTRVDYLSVTIPVPIAVMTFDNRALRMHRETARYLTIPSFCATALQCAHVTVVRWMYQHGL